MKYDSRLAKLFKAASKEESRYTLKAIKVDAITKVAIATDGHLLAAINIADLLEENETSFLVPVDAMKAADKLSRGRNAGTVHIIEHENRIALKQRENIVQTFDPISGQFPNYQAVIPSEQATKEHYKAAITISAELLLNLADALRGNDGNSTALTLWIKDADSCVIAAGYQAGTSTYGVIMPCRGSSNLKEALPFWANRDAKSKKDLEPIAAD